MKKIRNILLLIALVVILPLNVKAAGVSIKGSNISLYPGQSGSIAIRAYGDKAVAGGQFDAKSNSNKLSITGISGSGIFTNYGSSSRAIIYNAANNSSSSGSKIAVIKVKASASAVVGDVYKVTVSNAIVSLDNDYSTYNANNITVNVTIVEKPAEPEAIKSNDASLKILEAFTSYLDFNKDKYVYDISVPYEVTKLDLTAVTNNDKAKYEVIGNENLVEGSNIISIKVTAEDGSVKTYTINVMRNAKLVQKDCMKSDETFWKYCSLILLAIILVETMIIARRVIQVDSATREARRAKRALKKAEKLAQKDNKKITKTKKRK